MNLYRTAVFFLAIVLFALPGRADDFVWLFDGKSLSHWQTLDGRPVTRGWEVRNGTLHLSTRGERDGSIVTSDMYGDFELWFDWKISAGGNNGIKYRVQKFGNRTLGCEYQLIDDYGYKGNLRKKQLTGGLYDVYEPRDDRYLEPIGQFNHSRILVVGNHIEHWLNGQLIVSAEVGGPQWEQRISESKFKDVEGFGRNREGRIMLTDHNSEVWFRRVVLRKIHSPNDTLLTASRCGSNFACCCKPTLIRCCRRR